MIMLMFLKIKFALLIHLIYSLRLKWPVARFEMFGNKHCVGTYTVKYFGSVQRKDSVYHIYLPR